MFLLSAEAVSHTWWESRTHGGVAAAENDCMPTEEKMRLGLSKKFNEAGSNNSHGIDAYIPHRVIGAFLRKFQRWHRGIWDWKPGNHKTKSNR
jgi:hypothetical protein